MSDFTLVRTQTLVMEVLNLPPTDTNHKFLFRFLSPIETTWGEGKLAQEEYMAGEKPNLTEALGKFGAQVYKEMFKTAEGQELPENLKWALNITQVEVYYCKIERNQSV